MTMVCVGRGKNACYYMAGLLALFLLWPVQAFGDIAKSISLGDQAVAINDHLKADTIYTQVLETDPENFRVMISLAEVKIALKKFKEADTLLGQILAMEVSRGKTVLVTLEGESEPLESALVY